MTDKKASKFKLFFGASTVISCFIGMMGTSGGILFVTLGILVKPLNEEFGWNRGEIYLSLTFLTVGISLGLLLTAKLFERFGARKVLLTSVLFSGLVILTGPLYISSLPLLYGMMFLSAIIGAATNTVGYTWVITNWFDKRRGLFIGINASGFGLGMALMPTLCEWAVNLGGWRAGHYSLGLFMLIIVLPTLYFFLIEKPQDVGLLPDGKKPNDSGEQENLETEHHLSLSEAARTHVFWLMLTIILCLAFCLNGIYTQVVPLLTDRGIDRAQATLILSTIGISMAVGRICVGYVLDKLFAPYVAIGMFIMVISGIGLLTFTHYLPLYFVAGSMIALGLSAEADLMAYLTSRYFGTRHFGTIFACVFIMHMAGTSLGPPFLGRSFDINGNYQFILQVCMGLLLFATTLFAFLGPYNQFFKNKTA